MGITEDTSANHETPKVPTANASLAPHAECGRAQVWRDLLLAHDHQRTLSSPWLPTHAKLRPPTLQMASVQPLL